MPAVLPHSTGGQRHGQTRVEARVSGYFGAILPDYMIKNMPCLVIRIIENQQGINQLLGQFLCSRIGRIEFVGGELLLVLFLEAFDTRE